MSLNNSMFRGVFDDDMECALSDQQGVLVKSEVVKMMPMFPPGTAPMIVDVEGFHCPDRYVVKELAMYCPDSNARKCIILAPPFSRKHMLPKTIRTMDWVSLHLHGLEWNDGDHDYAVATHLLQLYGCMHKLFSKGPEKCKWISDLAMCPVYDLEVLGCPRVDELSHIDLDFKCDAHNNSDYSCALLKAYRFGKWYRDVLSMSALKTVTFCKQ